MKRYENGANVEVGSSNRSCRLITAADLDRVILGGLSVSVVDRKLSAEICMNRCKEGYGRNPAMIVFTVNGNTLHLTRTDKVLAQYLATADIVHADGQSIVFASRLLTNKPLPERCATTDFFHDMAKAASNARRSFFLLGGPPGLASRCADRMSNIYPNLEIKGSLPGFFASEKDTEQAVDYINASDPDILWVGLGVPREQNFVIKYRDRLNARIIVTCGGCFNYVTGDYPRAPRWMQDIGLEWLFRLIDNPPYLFSRYARSNPVAAWRLITETPRRQ